MAKPNFSPKTGIGTIYKDQVTGEEWQYSSDGWIKATNVINRDGNFDVGTENTELVNTLKLGGAKEDDIQNALSQRRQILATKQADTSSKPKNDIFAGKSKPQFLKEAFMNGVTDNTELENLGKTYDLLATQTGEDNDLSKMTPAEIKENKRQVEKTAVGLMQSLPDAVARESALGSLTVFRTGDEIIKTLEEGKVKTGLLAGGARRGIFGIGGRTLGMTTQEEDDFNALTEVFAANFRKAMSGTAIAESEMKRLERFLPSETKTEQDNISGIVQLANYLSDKTSLQLGTDISVLIPTRGNNDPLNINGGGNSGSNPLGI
jgi:hypothetical protein